MKPFVHRISFVLCVLVLVSAAEALNYLWLTNSERTRFGDYVRFGEADSLSGIIRSNDTLAFSNGYVPPCDLFVYAPFTNLVPNPECPGNIHLNSPHLVFTEVAATFRQLADSCDNFFEPDPFGQARIHIAYDQLLVWWGMIGEPVDTTVAPQTMALDDECDVLFFDCPITVQGILDGTLILASSGRIGLADNILYASSDPVTGALAPGHTEKFALVSEDEIKILNTPANGRENSHGLGYVQPNPAFTSIALNGFYIALGESFTFEQQNDPDSGYVCSCQPDNRGTIYLWGGIAQRRRGYLHRSNLISTGYQKQLRNDPALANWNLYLFAGPQESTDTLNFGDVVTGQTANDTAQIYVSDYSTLGMATATPPYVADPTLPAFGTHFTIPVHFTPPYVGSFNGLLQVTTTFDYFEIPLRGRGVIANAAPEQILHSVSAPSVLPNPFNASTTLSFVLETSGTVRADLYDVLGRHVATLLDGFASAGRQQLIVDGRTLASGVYFVHLMTPSRQYTLKLLLLK